MGNIGHQGCKLAQKVHFFIEILPIPTQTCPLIKVGQIALSYVQQTNKKWENSLLVGLPLLHYALLWIYWLNRCAPASYVPNSQGPHPSWLGIWLLQILVDLCLHIALWQRLASAECIPSAAPYIALFARPPTSSPSVCVALLNS